MQLTKSLRKMFAVLTASTSSNMTVEENNRIQKCHTISA